MRRVALLSVLFLFGSRAAALGQSFEPAAAEAHFVRGLQAKGWSALALEYLAAQPDAPHLVVERARLRVRGLEDLSPTRRLTQFDQVRAELDKLRAAVGNADAETRVLWEQARLTALEGKTRTVLARMKQPGDTG